MQITSSNILFFSIIAAIVPAFGYSLVIYWFDHYEKEPIWLLTATFFWGAVPSVILALIASLAFSAPLALIGGPSATNTIMAVFIAPPVEETVKAFALVAIFLMRREEIDSLLDGIIYGAMVGMGFAMVENIFYFVTVFQEQGVGAWGTTVFIRAVVFGLNHALFTSTTGLGLAVSRFSRARLLRIVTPIAGWSGAVMLHAIHNLAASNGGLLCLVLPFTDWGGVALILLIILWALLQERRWIRKYLKEEIGLGTLTARQYEVACSLRGRLADRLQALFNNGPSAYLAVTRFYRLCSELAYKKHHYLILHEAPSEHLTVQLRKELSDLSGHTTLNL